MIRVTESRHALNSVTVMFRLPSIRHALVKNMLLTVAIALVFVSTSSAAELNYIFQDHMVLQRDLKVRVYGTGTDGEQVAVTTAGQTKKTTVIDGRWMLYLDPVKAGGGPHTLEMQSGKTRIIRKDILFGDVWIVAGQSNMAYNTGYLSDAEELIDSSDNDKIRLLKINPEAMDAPADTPAAPRRRYQNVWYKVSPELLRNFSGVGYTFGRRVQANTSIPIGLIEVAEGGTEAECWMTLESLESMPITRLVLENYARGSDHRNRPTGLYNGTIAPVTRFGIKGVIWYQGESNSFTKFKAYQYRFLFPKLVKCWRASWGQGDFPFYYVQLASFRGRVDTPTDPALAWLREAQLLTLEECSNVGMAVAIDTGLSNDWHPKEKSVVGYRLADLALSGTYGSDKYDHASGPLYKSHAIKGKAVEITFANTGGGLTVNTVVNNNDKYITPDDSLYGFSLCGPDGKFIWAHAEITGKDSIKVSHPDIREPQAVRYAWESFPKCNLYNKEGYPASPFRTDVVEQMRVPKPVTLTPDDFDPETSTLIGSWDFDDDGLQGWQMSRGKPVIKNGRVSVECETVLRIPDFVSPPLSTTQGPYFFVLDARVVESEVDPVARVSWRPHGADAYCNDLETAIPLKKIGKTGAYVSVLKERGGINRLVFKPIMSKGKVQIDTIRIYSAK